MQKKESRAALSRGVAGIRGNVLIVNCRGALEVRSSRSTLFAELLPHALEVLRGARTIRLKFIVAIRSTRPTSMCFSVILSVSVLRFWSINTRSGGRKVALVPL